METHMPQHCVMRNEKNVVLASLSTNGGMKQKNNPPTQQQPQVKRERERERGRRGARSTSSTYHHLILSIQAQPKRPKHLEYDL